MTNNKTINAPRVASNETLSGDSLGDFFFWLGDDLSFQSVTREQFTGLVEKNKIEANDETGLRTRN